MTDIFSGPQISTENDRKEVVNSIKEASISLMRIDTEKDNIKLIAARMKEDFEITPGDFNACVRMYHKNSVEEQQKKKDDLFSLYDSIFVEKSTED